ncbi:MAG: DUF6580 family putative transport protein [Chitinophagaceae bacterium]
MSQKKNILSVVFIIFIVAIFRIVNNHLHIYNLIPIAALGIFSGSILKEKKYAYIIPLLAMLFSDIGIGLTSNMSGFYGISQIVNYTALIGVTFLGTRLNRHTPLRIAGFSLTASLIFFIVSNFGTYLSGYYGFGLESFINCYIMALPFYKHELATEFFLNAFIGDLLFSYFAFGMYHALNTKSSIYQLTTKTGCNSFRFFVFFVKKR